MDAGTEVEIKVEIIFRKGNIVGWPQKKLMDANVLVSLGGNRLRVSPALYNTKADIDILSGVLNS